MSSGNGIFLGERDGDLGGLRRGLWEEEVTGKINELMDKCMGYCMIRV